MPKRSQPRNHRLHPISTWYFLAAAVMCAIISVYALRQNNLTAVRLRDNVTTVDQQNGDVEAALKKLREYIYGHMNTNLAAPNGVYPPIQLKYRYERLVSAEKVRVEAVNSKIYTDAQATCEKQIPDGLSGRFRLDCIQAYVQSHGVVAQPIPDSLYKFNFQPPLWSSDLAGWSLVAAIFFLVLFMVRLGLDFWLRARVRE